MDKIKQIYNLFINSNGVSTDTRNIKQNQIFFALKGDNFNGNKYAETALKNGATYAIIDEEQFLLNNKTILVDNVLDCLQKLANYHRKQFKIPVIGITGTNGKTTTKELINTVLSKKYKTVYTKGNLNNHIGVPLTLLNINSKTEIAIIEMGANHPNEIDALCKIAEPDYGIITNVGKAHIEGFGSFENIIKTKTELYRFIINKKGKIVINNDDEILTKNIDYKNIYTYGTSINNFCVGQNPESNPFLKLDIIDNNKNVQIQTNLVGNYNFYNVLAAVSFGKIFEINIKDIKSAIENYFPDNMRSQLKKTEKNTLLIDAYNANPTSMNNAIDNIYKINADNKILILGDMLELGKISDIEHKKIIEKLLALNCKNVFLVGKIFNKINNSNYKSFNDTDDLIEYIKTKSPEKSFILIKGSRGIKLEKVIEYL